MFKIFKDKITSFKKGDILTFTFATTITLATFIDINFFHGRIMGIVELGLLIVLAFIIYFVFMKAGFIVLESFFWISAEMSFLIFIGQSYCNAKTIISSTDNILKSIIILSIFLISYKFIKSLKDALLKTIHDIPEKAWSWEKVVYVFLFISFALFFVWAVSEIVAPIILDLCIYKR